MGNDNSSNAYDPNSPVHFDWRKYANPFSVDGLAVYAANAAIDAGWVEPNKGERTGITKYLDTYAQNQYKSFESKAELQKLTKPHSTLYDQTNKVILGGLNKGEKFVDGVLGLGDSLLSFPGDLLEFVNDFKYPLMALGVIVAVKVVKD